MKGTPEQAWEYCCKGDGVPCFRGKLPNLPGKNLGDRWAEAIDSAKSGKMDEIPADLMTRFHGYYEKLQTKHGVHADLPDVCGIWVSGPSGCGKSRWVRDNHPHFYDKRMNKWFDGYDPATHDCILLDDMDLSHAFMAYDLNRWADRYSFTAETKGGMIRARPLHIIVTSRYTIPEIFAAADPSTVKSLQRRFPTHIAFLGE